MEKANELKKIVGYKAAELVTDGMIIGLGTGSTAYWAIQRIGEKVNEGLKVKAIASSLASEQLAIAAGIELVKSDDVEMLDLYIDGADEIDSEHYLIKGGGGALVREKILASNARQFIVIADASKLVSHLGRFLVPVELVPFSYTFALKHLRALGCEPVIRMKDNTIYVSDNGNYIADCRFGTISDPRTLSQQINMIPGVVDNGIFDKKLVSRVITN